MSASNVSDPLLCFGVKVPECIEKLANAGIRIWVVTGDKMETAINIGYGRHLIIKTLHFTSLLLQTSR